MASSPTTMFPDIVEEQPHPTDEPVEQAIDMQPRKQKGRQRLLRGLSRMASSPSLAQPGRARSASTPYSRSGASLSCVSLASSPSPYPSPFVPSSSGSSGGYPFPPLSSSSSSAWPGTPNPADSSSLLAIRKIDLPIDSPASASSRRPKRSFFYFWTRLPHEIKIHILGFLQPKQLVRLSGVCRQFHRLCFDGQLWASFDATPFYHDIPPASLSKIITVAGPFVKDLNLRGYIQPETNSLNDSVALACENLLSVSLKDCAALDRHVLDGLLSRNTKLAHVDISSVPSAGPSTCDALAASCPQLEVLNVSWCFNLTATDLVRVVEACPRLRDLRAGEVAGFDRPAVAEALFRTNRLERLVLAGCKDLTDAALSTVMRGRDGPLDAAGAATAAVDLLTGRPLAPPRRLRHLDLSRCQRLTDRGIAALAHCVPDLEGLVLAGCSALTDDALAPLLPTTPRLTLLDLEDLGLLTNSLLADHLAKAPCAARLAHLSISNCERLGDAGVLPLLRACQPALRSLDLDNTRISDLVLTEATAMVRARHGGGCGSSGSRNEKLAPPRLGLAMAVYDCPNVHWTGVVEVLSRNAEMLARNRDRVGASSPPEIIRLKCYFGWQMTVDEHTKRVLRGDLAAAARLERKWAEYMQAHEEAVAAAGGGGGGGVGGRAIRRRRRRAREAQLEHDEVAAEGDGLGAAGSGIGRRRVRATTCAVM